MKMKIEKGALLLILIVGIGFLATTSCKRGNVEDQGITGPAGFRISLSGTANPSTLYVPEALPAVSSRIRITAMNNDGTPAANYNIIFEESGGYGYFTSNFRISEVVTTNASGVAETTYYIPAGVGVRSTVMTNITATLVDDGRLDNTAANIYDVIPIQIIPYIQQGFILSGYITTQAGNPVEGIVVQLIGDGDNLSGVDITRPAGGYKFYVPSGWYGTIQPSTTSYTFVPVSHTFSSTAPVYNDYTNLDFLAYFGAGESLAVDIAQWEVPAEGGTQVVNVYNNTGDAVIDYSVSDSYSWIHVSPSTGSTPGSFTITVDENATGVERTGTVTVTATSTVVSSTTITITQRSHDVSEEATLAADRVNLNVLGDGGTEQVYVYNSTTSETISFFINTDEDWLTIAPSLTASTPTTLSIIVAANTGAARTGTITLTPYTTGGTNSLTITVNQEAGASLAVSPDTYSALAAGGEIFTVTVTNPTTSDVLSWTLESSVGWLFPSTTSGTTGNSFTITVQTANPSSSPRVGVITLTASNGATATVTVNQQGS